MGRLFGGSVCGMMGNLVSHSTIDKTAAAFENIPKGILCNHVN